MRCRRAVDSKGRGVVVPREMTRADLRAATPRCRASHRAAAHHCTSHVKTNHVQCPVTRDCRPCNLQAKPQQEPGPRRLSNTACLTKHTCLEQFAQAIRERKTFLSMMLDGGGGQTCSSMSCRRWTSLVRLSAAALSSSIICPTLPINAAPQNTVEMDSPSTPSGTAENENERKEGTDLVRASADGGTRPWWFWRGLVVTCRLSWSSEVSFCQILNVLSLRE